MAKSSPPAAPERWRLSLDGWAVLAALVLAALVWVNLLPPIGW